MTNVYLRLGRVSNLPTVWSNTLAGVWLAGGRDHVLPLALAMSAFYVGGMYLNDWFDRGIDARERPERPIPSGAVSADRVLAIGGGLLVAGVAGVAAVSGAALGAALALAAAIVVYDAWHKGNPISPVLMGLCRVLVYLTCAAAVGATRSVWPAAACLLAYLVGLTYTAKQEGRAEWVARTWPLVGLAAPLAYALPRLSSWLAQLAFAALLGWIVRCLAVLRSDAPRRIPRTVTGLIAGIALVDALLLAGAGAPVRVVALAALAFPLTLLGQRHVPGT